VRLGTLKCCGEARPIIHGFGFDARHHASKGNQDNVVISIKCRSLEHGAAVGKGRHGRELKGNGHNDKRLARNHHGCERSPGGHTSGYCRPCEAYNASLAFGGGRVGDRRRGASKGPAGCKDGRRISGC
jgi:hypothetical protein